MALLKAVRCLESRPGLQSLGYATGSVVQLGRSQQVGLQQVLEACQNVVNQQQQQNKRQQQKQQQQDQQWQHQAKTSVGEPVQGSETSAGTFASMQPAPTTQHAIEAGEAATLPAVGQCSDPSIQDLGNHDHLSSQLDVHRLLQQYTDGCGPGHDAALALAADVLRAKAFDNTVAYVSGMMEQGPVWPLGG